MSLVLHNTLSRKKEAFVPLNGKNVSMYVCGPTVYELLHVGNFRGPLVTSLLRNWLTYLGYQVTFAQNFTDVDDKIINRAKEQNQDSAEFAKRYISEYKKDFSSLGLRPHDLNPTVTETMTEIIQMIDKLISANKAYVAGNDVLYKVRSFNEYGKLSGRKVDELESGARVEVDEKKNDPLDFALWKGAKPGEPAWPSPWGPGRPGWHIECSAMVCKHFGESIDIHCGGSDLIFPHHENEIAQSEGATGKLFSKYWIHWSMLNFGGQKMSKSLGNIISLREFISENHPEIYKWMILSAHYRTSSDFTEEAVHRAVTGLARVYSSLSLAQTYAVGANPEMAKQSFKDSLKQAWAKVEESLNDDLNTPEVFAAIFESVRMYNSLVKRGAKTSSETAGNSAAFISFIQKTGSILSMFQEEPHGFLKQMDDRLLEKANLKRSDVEVLVQARWQSRQAKDYAKSDEIRAQLTQMGISVSDMAEGSHWEVSK